MSYAAKVALLLFMRLSCVIAATTPNVVANQSAPVLGAPGGRTELCPSDACWLPMHYENINISLPKSAGGNLSLSDGRCVTRASYQTQCTSTAHASDGAEHGCYFCVKAPEQEGVGFSDGVCTQVGTSLGKPPAGTVYPGVSGRWPHEQGKAKLNQLICGGFHLCHCDDVACLSAQSQCVDAALSEGSAEHVCCQSVSKSSGTLPSELVAVFTIACTFYLLV